MNWLIRYMRRVVCGSGRDGKRKETESEEKFLLIHNNKRKMYGGSEKMEGPITRGTTVGNY